MKLCRANWSVGRLARALGRPYSTVWRWVVEAVTAGALPDCRTLGGHRRIPAHLARAIVGGTLELAPVDLREAA